MKMNEKLYFNILEELFSGNKQNIIRCEALGFPWEASELFIKEDKGQIISHVALLECPVLIEGIWHKLGAMHGICTRSDYRGQGLATELIQEALLWSKGPLDAVLLFTEIPSFYEQSLLIVSKNTAFICQGHIQEAHNHCGRLWPLKIMASLFAALMNVSPSLIVYG